MPVKIYFKDKNLVSINKTTLKAVENSHEEWNHILLKFINSSIQALSHSNIFRTLEVNRNKT